VPQAGLNKENRSMLFHLFRKPRRKVPARPARFRPRLEALEDRCLPSSGPLDPTFGSGGTATSLLGTSSIAYATALQSDGKILAAAQATVAQANQFALARYTTTGSLDSTFGSGGRVTTKVGNGGFAYALAVQPGDGKIVLGGYGSFRNTGWDFALARYNTGGSLDTSFGSRGLSTTDLGGANEEVDALAIQSDGKILAAGDSGNSGAWEWALARYTSNGGLDASFGSGGTVRSAFGGHAEINGMALQSDGKIIVAGYVSLAGLDGQQFTVARYNVNGSLDTTFGANHTGLVSLQPLAARHPDRAYGVVIQSDGKIVAAGQLAAPSGANFEWALARLNSDGTLDGTFGSGGVVTQEIVAGAGVNDVAYAVKLQVDGKLVVAGTHDADNRSGQEAFALGRFNPDGSLDTTFHGTGLVTTMVGTGSDARGVLIQPADGKIVVAGGAIVNGAWNFAVARYVATDPRIGSFTASPDPVATGSNVTLTASNITDTNPGGSITQVAFYLDSNGDGKLEPGSDTLLGTATQSSPGIWVLTFSTATAGLAPGTYTLFAQAEDNYGLFSDPFALALTVQ
jgi:uncharacterized delta-60 repeat protein